MNPLSDFVRLRIDGLLLETGTLAYLARLAVADLRDGENNEPLSASWRTGTQDAGMVVETLDRTLRKIASGVEEMQQLYWGFPVPDEGGAGPEPTTGSEPQAADSTTEKTAEAARAAEPL